MIPVHPQRVAERALWLIGVILRISVLLGGPRPPGHCKFGGGKLPFRG